MSQAHSSVPSASGPGFSACWVFVRGSLHEQVASPGRCGDGRTSAREAVEELPALQLQEAEMRFPC